MGKQDTFTCRMLLLSSALFCALSAGLAQVEISNPSSGQTVRGTIDIQATKPDAAHGWISYKIEGPQQSGDFSAAIVNPFRYRWDTNSRDATGKPVFPDGEYTITAVAHLPSGQKVGQDSVRVTLQNDLSSGQQPTSVRLQTGYRRGREMDVDGTGRARSKLIEHDDLNQKIIELFSGFLSAEWRERAMSNSAGSSAIVRMFFDKGYTSFQGTKPTNLRRVGDIFTVIVNPDSSISRKHKGDPTFDLGELYLELPDRTMREGSTWKSTMYVLPMLRSDRRKVMGDHRLDGFQWVGGYKCARIVSTYSENGVNLKVRMGVSSATPAGPQAADAGIGLGFPPGGLGSLLLGPQADMMGPAAAPGGMGEGATTGTISVSAPPEVEVKTSYKGTRVSYFAFEMGQFVRSEDIITHKLTIDNSKFGGGTRGGPGDMMGGLMGPEAGPAGPLEPLLAGDSAERDWGMRQPQQQPKVEVKKEFEAESQVTLTIAKRG